MRNHSGKLYIFFFLAIIISFVGCDKNNDGTDDIPKEIV